MALDGNWKVARSENYEKFMEQMGVNVMKRKLGAHDNLKITIQQEGNKFTVKESSTFRSIEIIFMLGVNFEYSLADGTELSVRNPLLYEKPVFNKTTDGYREVGGGKGNNETILVCMIGSGLSRLAA
uniref:Fatty acid binding protein 2 n=1 Tax=Gopherus evgoodei TaxID=1825980 RepID=A0A8C4YFI2_9SAUR